MLTPTQRVFAGAFLGACGGIAATVAVVLLVQPGSNMVGVAAILIGAPAGAIAGALLGDRENRAIIILWILTLLATLALAIGPKLMTPAIAVQVLFALAAFRFRTPHRWPLAAIFILTAALSCFPPVTSDHQHFAGFTSIFDSRLSASRHVPELTVLRWLLFVEWAAAAAVAIPLIRSAQKNSAGRTAGATQNP